MPLARETCVFIILTNYFTISSIQCVIYLHLELRALICKLEEQNQQGSLQCHGNLHFHLQLKMELIPQHIFIFSEEFILIQITLKLFPLIRGQRKNLDFKCVSPLVGQGSDGWNMIAQLVS